MIEKLINKYMLMDRLNQSSIHWTLLRRPMDYSTHLRNFVSINIVSRLKTHDPFQSLLSHGRRSILWKTNSVYVQYLDPLGKITVLHLNKLYYKQVFGWNCRRALQKVVNILPLIFLFSFIGMIPYNLRSLYLRMHWAKFLTILVLKF